MKAGFLFSGAAWHTGGLLAGLLLVVAACSTDDPTAPVIPVAFVVVDPVGSALEIGATVALNATARAADGSLIVGRAISWRTIDSSVATVTAGGVVHARGAGSTAVVATSDGRDGQTTIVVAAAVPAAASVAIAPGDIELEPNATEQLRVQLRDVHGADLPAPPLNAVEWTSSDETIAWVRPDGMVTALRAGSVTITAAVANLTATAVVTVPEWFTFTLSRGTTQPLPITIATIPQVPPHPNVEVTHLIRLTAGQLRLSTDGTRYEQTHTVETWESTLTSWGSTIVRLLSTDVIEDVGSVGTVSGVGDLYFLSERFGVVFSGARTPDSGFTTQQRVGGWPAAVSLVFGKL